MKAAVLTSLNSPLEVAEVLWPELEVGQVLVRVYAAGICGAQIGEITGAKGPDKFLPHLLGHEGAGVVVDMGPGVTMLSRGDRVVLHWRKGAGIDAAPPVYTEAHNRDRKIGAGPVATWAEYAVVSENRCTRIEHDVPFEVAALLGCAVTTGLGLVFHEANLRPGQSVLVFGAGGVGLNVIQAAHMVSAYPIMAVDIDILKLSFSEDFGATHIVLSKHFDLKHVKGPTLGSQGFDLVVDCTGNPQVIETGMEALRTGGKMLLVGQPRHDQDLVLRSFRKHYCGKTMMDCQGGLTDPGEDIPRYLSLWRAGKLPLLQLITNTFPLEKVNEAVEEVIAGKVLGRCILLAD